MNEALWPHDRFYEDYSLSVDFGHSGKDEFNNIKSIIEEKGLTSSDRAVWDSLEFVKKIYPHIRQTCKQEIASLKSSIQNEKITAGIIPPDIFFAYEILKFAIECGILGITIVDFIKKSRNRENSPNIQGLEKSVVEKIALNNYAHKIIINQINTTKDWTKKRTKSKRKTIKKKKLH